MSTIEQLVNRAMNNDKIAAQILLKNPQCLSLIPEIPNILLQNIRILISDEQFTLKDRDIESDFLIIPAILYKNRTNPNFLTSEEKKDLLTKVVEYLQTVNAITFIDEESISLFFLGYSQLQKTKEPSIPKINFDNINSYLLTENDVFIAFSLIFYIFTNFYRMFDMVDAHKNLAYLFLYPFINKLFLQNFNFPKSFFQARDTVILDILKDMKSFSTIPNEAVVFISRKCGISFNKILEFFEIIPEDMYQLALENIEAMALKPLKENDFIKKILKSNLNNFQICTKYMDENAIIDIIGEFVAENFIQNPIYCINILNSSKIRKSLAFHFINYYNISNFNANLTPDIIEFFHIIFSFCSHFPAVIPEEYRINSYDNGWDDVKNEILSEKKFDCDKKPEFYCENCKKYFCYHCITKHINHIYTKVTPSSENSCCQNQAQNLRKLDIFISFLFSKCLVLKSYTCNLFNLEPSKYNYNIKTVIQRSTIKLRKYCDKVTVYDTTKPKKFNFRGYDFFIYEKRFEIKCNPNLTYSYDPNMLFYSPNMIIFIQDKRIFKISEEIEAKEVTYELFKYYTPISFVIYEDFVICQCKNRILVFDFEINFLINELSLEDARIDSFIIFFDKIDYVALTSSNQIYVSPLTEPALIFHSKIDTKSVKIYEKEKHIFVSNDLYTDIFTYESFLSHEKPLFTIKKPKLIPQIYIPQISSFLFGTEMRNGFYLFTLYDQRVYFRFFDAKNFEIISVDEKFVFKTKGYECEIDTKKLISCVFRNKVYLNPYPNIFKISENEELICKKDQTIKPKMKNISLLYFENEKKGNTVIINSKKVFYFEEKYQTIILSENELETIESIKSCSCSCRILIFNYQFREKVVSFYLPCDKMNFQCNVSSLIDHMSLCLNSVFKVPHALKKNIQKLSKNLCKNDYYYHFLFKLMESKSDVPEDVEKEVVYHCLPNGRSQSFLKCFLE